MAANGKNVYVAWVDYQDANEEEYFRRSVNGGLSWEPIIRLTNDPADSWAASMGVSGTTIHFVWFDRRDAGLLDSDVEQQLNKIMEKVGLPTEPIPPREASVYYLPGFTQRVQAKVQKIQAAAPGWVAGGGDPKELERLLKIFQNMMEQWTEGWEIYYKRSTDGGASWSKDIRLTYDPKLSARPSIAVSGTNLHIVWFDDRDGNTEIYYKHSPDAGITWEPDVHLTNAAGDSLHPTIAISHNMLHIVWFDQRDGNHEIYYKRGMCGSASK